jgi:hypothetical protein
MHCHDAAAANIIDANKQLYNSENNIAAVAKLLFRVHRANTGQSYSNSKPSAALHAVSLSKQHIHLAQH